MKKRDRLTYATVLLLLVTASCKNDPEFAGIKDDDNRSTETAIGFTTNEPGNDNNGALRSAGDLTTANIDAMAVYAYYTGTQDMDVTQKPNFMFNQSVVKSASAWTYSPTKYWPPQDQKVSFFAIAPAPDGTEIIGPASSDAAGYPAFTVNTPSATEDMHDICVAPNVNVTKSSNSGKVSLSLKHTTAKVTFSARYKGNMPVTKGYVKIKTISWSADLVQSATLRFTGTSFEWADLATPATYTLSETNAYFNTGSLLEEKATGDSSLFSEGGTLLFIPQTITATVAFTASLYNRLDAEVTNYAVSKTLPAQSLAAGSRTDYAIMIDLDKDRTVWKFVYTGAAQAFIVPEDGVYRLEAHGASGYSGIAGGHVSGDIALKKGTTLYIYVGERDYAFNGGGGRASGGSYYHGGGATDFRLVSGAWNVATSLNSRILVAGAGAGTGSGGYGGGLSGGDGNGGYGGTQIAGGDVTGGACWSGGWGGLAGVFCAGGRGGWSATYGGGGGGYYGGGGASDCGARNSGGGGSSFISGFTGCVAIDPTTTTNPRGQDTGTDPTALNYNETLFGATNPTWADGDEIIFDNPVMIAGDNYKWEAGAREASPTGVMPTPPDDVTQTGSGYAVITRIG